MVCIVGIIAGGRILVRPLYRAIASTGNAEMFAATTLLVCLGTAELTLVFGLSLALGAFLAGLLLAETEYALQVGYMYIYICICICICICIERRRRRRRRDDDDDEQEEDIQIYTQRLTPRSTPSDSHT